MAFLRQSGDLINEVSLLLETVAVLLLEAEACGNGHHPAVLAHYCSWPVQCRHEETGVSKMAAVCVRAEVQTALFMLPCYTS